MGFNAKEENVFEGSCKFQPSLFEVFPVHHSVKFQFHNQGNMSSYHASASAKSLLSGSTEQYRKSLRWRQRVLMLEGGKIYRRPENYVGGRQELPEVGSTLDKRFNTEGSRRGFRVYGGGASLVCYEVHQKTCAPSNQWAGGP